MALLNRSKPVYTDIDMSFNINPITKDIAIVNDYHAVAQSIHNIIMSHKLWNFDKSTTFVVGFSPRPIVNVFSLLKLGI